MMMLIIFMRRSVIFNLIGGITSRATNTSLYSKEGIMHDVLVVYLEKLRDIE
jgi:hypothetical protein